MLLDEYKKLNENLTSEEVEEELIVQEDFDMIVQWLQENGYAEISDEYSVYSEAVVSTNKMQNKQRVMSKEQYYNLTKSMAALSAARAANSADYQKLVKVSRLRKKLIAKINKQYNSAATRTAKKALKAAKKTSQTVVKTPKEGISGTKGTPNKPKVIKESDKK